LDFFDRPEFYFILIPALWLWKGWRWGLRLFYILFISSLTNYGLKQLFFSPRPFHLDPNVGIIQVPGYGFPSGAAQTVILLSGLLLHYWKSSWKWPVVVLYVLLIPFSRIYLGIHFPTDILAGWMIGLVLWALFTYVRPAVETQLMKLNVLSLFLLSQLVPLVLLLWQQQSPSAIRNGASAMGMGMGLFINYCRGYFLAPSKTKKESILRASVGVIGTFLCYYLLSLVSLPESPLALFFRPFLMGMWVATGSLLLCRKIFPLSRDQISL
jgi:undecaprenyl-diphosphatase